MSSITVTRLYEKLSTRLGKETAEDLTSYICGEIKEGLEDKTKILATKQDILELQLATKQDTADLRGELKQEISELRVEMKQDKADMVKWMFLFWIGQVAATFAIVIAFMKK